MTDMRKLQYMPRIAGGAATARCDPYFEQAHQQHAQRMHSDGLHLVLQDRSTSAVLWLQTANLAAGS